MKIGILTGGGDCPGLNAVIRAVVRKAAHYKYDVLGIKDGWMGLIEANVIPLDIKSVTGILSRGGTILGTSRTNPFKSPDTAEKVVNNIKKLGLDVVICVGGDDTLGVAAKLLKQGIKTIGIPKTIDNDLYGTDFTFGFDTAVSIVTEALDRLHTTTEAHHRTMVVEVMGRHAGWIATYGGLAGGADMILIPETPFEVEGICKMVTKRAKEGRGFSIIVVAEGAVPKGIEGYITKDVKKDAFGHVMLGGIGEFLAKEIEKKTGVETRHVVLGHLQRGGSPTAYDRILACRYGVRAVDLINEGKFGRMVALQGNKIVDIPLAEGVKQTKTVDMEIYKVAEVFFG
ncbi:MAG: 6-phosphofructokinase [Deltaproteobacteria bacterium]|nr:6-phosphofructokinase [Deltaproteobacteria bacterium]